MIRWIEDQIFAFLQRRCPHPDEMVAADILEGDVKHLELKWCRRCGAVGPRWVLTQTSTCLRLPDPNLWRG